MSGDKPVGAVIGVAVAVAVCCGVHALLLLGGGITLVGLSLRSSALAFAGLIVLALAAVWFRRRRCPVPAARRDRTESSTDAHHSRTD